MRAQQVVHFLFLKETFEIIGTHMRVDIVFFPRVWRVLNAKKEPEFWTHLKSDHFGTSYNRLLVFQSLNHQTKLIPASL